MKPISTIRMIQKIRRPENFGFLEENETIKPAAGQKSLFQGCSKRDK